METPVANAILDQHLPKLQAKLLDCMGKVYPSYFKAFEEHIMLLADNAGSNELQWQLFAKAREIRQQQNQLARRFDESIVDRFIRFKMGKLRAANYMSDTSSDLGLIANADLEKEIAVSSFARRIEGFFADDLFGIVQRMAIVRGGKKLDDDENPLGPIQLAEALAHMLNPLKLDNRLMGQACNLFELQSKVFLKEFYEEVNQYFIEQDILPNLKYSLNIKASPAPSNTTESAQGENAAEREEQGRVVEQSPNQSQTHLLSEQQMADRAANYIESEQEAGSIASMAQPQSPQALVKNIFDLQSRRRHGQQAAHSAQASTPESQSTSSHPQTLQQPVQANAMPEPQSGEAQSFDQMLNDLGDDLSGSRHTAYARMNAPLIQGVNQVAPVNTQLLPQFDQEQTPALTQSDIQQVSEQMQAHALEIDSPEESLNMIELVGQMFEFLLEDENLPDAVKSVLSYLHTPYLKLALADQDLFQETQHDARQLLDVLAEAGRKWVNDDGSSQLNIFGQIKATVRQFITRFDDEPMLARDLAEQMAKFNEKVERKLSQLESRAKAKTEGEEQVRSIKRRVYFSIKKMLGDFDLPAPIMVLLFHPLADYLALVGLRFGENSERWQEYVELYTQVVNSVNPSYIQSLESFEISDVVERNAESLEKTARLLNELAFDSARSQRLLEFLQKAQTSALEGKLFSLKDSDQEQAWDKSAKPLVENDDFDDEAKSFEEEQLLSEIESLRFGVLLDWERLPGDIKRYKIAWSNKNSHRMMLTDNSGMQREVHSTIALVRAMQSGNLRIVTVNEKPFFERALENIFSRLKQMPTAFS